MHIHRLRQKIDDGFECRLIRTGYRRRLRGSRSSAQGWSSSRL